jgi:hypothetical protein
MFMTLARRIALIVLAVSVVAFGSAQVGQLSVEHASTILLQRKNVQTELKMSATQVKGVEAEFKRYAEVVQKLVEGRKPGQEKAFAQSLDRERRTSATRMYNSLTVTQRVRLKQLGLQYFGPFAMLEDSVGKELGISTAQKGAMRREQDALRKAAGDLRNKREAELKAVPQPKNPSNEKEVAAYRQKIQKLVESFRAQDQAFMDKAKNRAEANVVALLTAAQKTKWAAMKGRTFKFA